MKRGGGKGKFKRKAKIAMKGKESELSTDKLQSLEKGGIHFWITENGQNLSVGER